MSLRARLVMALLAVVAAGLLGTSVATTAALGRYLQDRTDQQLRDSRFPVFSELARGEVFPGRPSGRSVILTGTFGELRRPSGTIVQYRSGDFAQPSLARLDESASPDPEWFFSTQATDGAHYRVLSSILDDGSVLTVALPLGDNRQTLSRLVRIEVLACIGVLAALALVSWWVVRIGLRPLAEISETAKAIAAGDLSERVARADDRTEVGRLGLALNSMLGRIEAAFAEREASEVRLRRFVADASHELRTPLTSIRGYAELFHRGAAERPEDLAVAMRRIEEESARMGGLVEDLLLLARLDEHRPPALTTIDLATVAADAVADARASAPGHHLSLEVEGHTIVSGDEGQLRQVTANLLTNAVTHTPVGTTIAVRVQGRPPGTTLEVADNGPGIPDEAAPSVFERFYRADPARSRTTGGSGLGLSIVAAIAEAHGGTAEHVPTKGGGATFRVTLPTADGPDRGGVSEGSVSRV